MISVPWHERVIYLRYDIALRAMIYAFGIWRNGYYIMLAKQVYHTACRISYRVSDISLKITCFRKCFFFRRNVEFSELIPQALLQMNKRIKEKLYFRIKVTGG